MSAFDMDQSGGLSREEVVAALEAQYGEFDPATVDPAVIMGYLTTLTKTGMGKLQ